MVPGLADTETGNLHDIDPGDVQAFYIGDWRPDVQPRLEFPKRVDRPDGQDLDIPVGKVDRVAVNAQSLCLATRAVTEPDTLDTALDREKSCLDGHGVSVFRGR